MKIYIASGWFNERDERILSSIEGVLSIMDVKVYSPRRDGIKLSSYDFHSHELRKKVFNSNVENIDDSDLLVANLDGGSDRLDTGTVWEVARACAEGIPVIVYDETGKLKNTLRVCSNYLHYIVSNKEDLRSTVELFLRTPRKYPPISPINLGGRSNALYVLDDYSHIYGVDTLSRYIDTITLTDWSECISSTFSDTKLIVVPTDHKSPLCTWYMSFAYYLGIPVITYSEDNKDLNLMLIMSVLQHCKGFKSLESSLDTFFKVGLSAFKEYDTTEDKVY